MKSLRVLLVEDDPDDAELLLRAIQREGYAPVHARVDNEPDLRRALEKEWDLIFCDWTMPAFDAPAALEVLKQTGLELPFVIVSGTIGEDTAVSAMRVGADDFLLKGNLARLGPVVSRELAGAEVRRRRRETERALRSREAILTAVGSATERLIRSSSWEEAVREVLSAIGPVTGASHLLVYQNRAREGGREGVLRLAWQAEEAASPEAGERLRVIRWARLGPIWDLAIPEGGLAIAWGDPAAADTTRRWMAAHEARSLCLVPVRSGTAWWGGLLVLSGEPRPWSGAEISALRVLADALGATIERKDLLERLKESHDELADAYDRTLEGWAMALELRDKETAGHARRVTEMTVRLAREMGIDDRNLIQIRRGAVLHDIGKMGIPDSILLKPGPLTEKEWAIMKLHPVYAYEMLRSIPQLWPALEIPHAHHERWDGSGYPQGLAGEEIPLSARIFAVVDVWDAMRSPRPYRDPIPDDAALAEIESQAGIKLDPAVVEAFLRLVRGRRERATTATRPAPS